MAWLSLDWWINFYVNSIVFLKNKHQMKILEEKYQWRINSFIIYSHSWPVRLRLSVHTFFWIDFLFHFCHHYENKGITHFYLVVAKTQTHLGTLWSSISNALTLTLSLVFLSRKVPASLARNSDIQTNWMLIRSFSLSLAHTLLCPSALASSHAVILVFLTSHSLQAPLLSLCHTSFLSFRYHLNPKTIDLKWGQKSLLCSNSALVLYLL